jgi:hypothetical protein
MQNWGGRHVGIRKRMQQENGENYMNEKLHNLYLSSDIIRVITTTRIGELYV